MAPKSNKTKTINRIVPNILIPFIDLVDLMRFVSVFSESDKRNYRASGAKEHNSKNQAIKRPDDFANGDHIAASLVDLRPVASVGSWKVQNPPLLDRQLFNSA